MNRERPVKLNTLTRIPLSLSHFGQLCVILTRFYTIEILTMQILDRSKEGMVKSDRKLSISDGRLRVGRASAVCKRQPRWAIDFQLNKQSEGEKYMLRYTGLSLGQRSRNTLIEVIQNEPQTS